MIIVSVHLVSAIDGEVTELARMRITNDGTGTVGIGRPQPGAARSRARTALGTSPELSPP